MKRLKQVLFLISLMFIIQHVKPRSFEGVPCRQLPNIDGNYEDVINQCQTWQFIQLEPSNGQPSGSSTKLIAYYNHQALYIGIACYQKAAITASIQARDKFAQSDDNIILILGTFNDNRNGYAFGVNPIGTQADFKIMDDGRTTDYNWDTEWKSATKITDWGWFAEFEIPFKSLRYKSDQTQWQFDIRRSIRVNSEISYWSGPKKEEFKISLSGNLDNITAPNQKNDITMVPYVMNQLKVTDNTLSNSKMNNQIGGDIKWKVNSNLLANATINPDFATVEADEEVIDLTRYEIEYPEKRIFFQEGNEMYDTRLKTFYSRRIGDIDFAGKVNGKIGKTNLNIISAIENATGKENQPLFNVVRLKRDILKSSSIGMTLTNKSDTTTNSSISADYVLNLGKLWKFTGQYVGVVRDFDMMRHAGYLRFAAENNFFHWHIRYSYFDGDGFKKIFNESGYTKDDDRQEFDSDISYKWWMKGGSLKFTKFTSKNNAYWNHDYGIFKGYVFTLLSENYFKNRINLDFRYNNEYRYDVVTHYDYYNYIYEAAVGYNTEAYDRIICRSQYGRSFGSHIKLIEAEARIKLLNKWALEFKPRYIAFEPQTTKYKDAVVYGISNTYNFSNDLWVKLINQYNSATDKVYVYGLAGWRFKPPFGNLFFVITHNEQREMAGFTNNYVSYIKFTYPLSF